VQPLLGLAYSAATESAQAVTELLGHHGERSNRTDEAKWLRAVRDRSGLLARYREWATTHRSRDRPLLWIHAPSVGEGLQARPILERLRANRPDLQIAYTFYSPSARPFADALRPALADFTDYLPFDTVAGANAALDALAPTALIFSKLDVWPVLVDRAATRHVRLGLISATLAPSSSRLNPIARAVLSDAYAHLDAVGAIAEGDATRLATLGVRPSTITVTGDTRYDQVWSRAHAAKAAHGDHSDRPRPIHSNQRVLVAGSTWPSDESVLLDAWRTTPNRPTLVIAPHEPTPAHLAAIERWAATAGIPTARLGAPTADRAELVIVDRLGVLGDLYGTADMAYVGGAFHAAGLHSTLEPAAFGVPVLFGPRYQASRDADLLIAAGAAHSVANRGDLIRWLTLWVADDTARRAAGQRAQDVVRQGLGAADRSVALIARLLGG
jgi:3-deoxy-D-manno-octulosonic-acid transferase